MAIVITPISPVAFSVFGMPIRWYALAYICAFVIGYLLFKQINKNFCLNFTKKSLDDLLTYIILGVIFGGRLGYVFFYNFDFFLHTPLEIFALWHGGMSFHGGLIGVIISVFLYARNWTNGLRILDTLSVVSPVGLFFGRIANFINMEIMGRPTTSVFGVVFAGETPVPRHPSPLYEAFAEGIVLFVVMICIYRFTKLRNHAGALSGCFAIGYAIARIVCEQFRMPDSQIGFLTTWGLTMGQMLSGIMFLGGIALLVNSKTK